MKLRLTPSRIVLVLPPRVRESPRNILLSVVTGQNEFGNPGSAGTVLLAKTCCVRLILLQRAGGLGGYEKHRCVCSSVPVVSRLRAKPQASDPAEHTAGAVAHHS